MKQEDISIIKKAFIKDRLKSLKRYECNVRFDCEEFSECKDGEWIKSEDLYEIINEFTSSEIIVENGVEVSLFCQCIIPNLNYGKGENKECNKCGKLVK